MWRCKSLATKVLVKLRIGKRYAELLEKGGLSHAEISSVIGVSKETLSRIKNGAPCSGATAAAIADFFGETIDSMLDPRPVAEPATPRMRQLDEKIAELFRREASGDARAADERIRLYGQLLKERASAASDSSPSPRKR